MTILGPCSHWSRQPDLLARTRPLSPRATSLALSAFCNSAWPAGSQHPRGLDASRTLVQTKMWRSNLGISVSLSTRGEMQVPRLTVAHRSGLRLARDDLRREGTLAQDEAIR